VPTPFRNVLLSALVVLAAFGIREAAGQQLSWQADLQIRTLEITRSRTGLSVRVLVYTEHDDDARDARLVVLLPVGVGVKRLGAGCTASAGPSMVPALRASVICELGTIADRGYYEVLLSITQPPRGVPTRLAVFAYSGTPDPRPGNNYAERVLP
jgi:hypothetical protein